MRAIELDNVLMHVREEGDSSAPALVFANSLGTDLRLWDDLLPHLPEGFRTIRFDKRGHGLSSCPPAPYSLDQLTEDVVQLLDRLGIERCTFIGTSIGGLMGQNLAVSRPDLVENLILTNTAPKMGEPNMWQARVDAIRDSGLSSIADDVLRRWFGPRFHQSLELSLWRSMLISTRLDSYIGCCAAIAGADLSAHLPAISQRTLVVGGALDQACAPELVERMAARIPNSDCHILDGVGHLPSVEAPKELARLIMQFLGEGSHA